MPTGVLSNLRMKSGIVSHLHKALVFCTSKFTLSIAWGEIELEGDPWGCEGPWMGFMYSSIAIFTLSLYMKCQ